MCKSEKLDRCCMLTAAICIHCKDTTKKCKLMKCVANLLEKIGSECYKGCFV